MKEKTLECLLLDELVKHSIEVHKHPTGVWYLTKGGEDVPFKAVQHLVKTLRYSLQITWGLNRLDPTLQGLRLDVGIGFSFRFLEDRRVSSTFEIRTDNKTRIVFHK